MSEPNIVARRWPRILFLVVFCGLSLSRLPNALEAPCLFGMDAQAYAQGLRIGPLAVLGYVVSAVGYFNLIQNVAASVALLLPVESAPVAFTAFALVVQLLPFALIATGQGPFFESWTRRILVALALLFLPTMMSETWLTTTHSHLHFGLIALVLLLDDASGARWGWLRRGVLVFAVTSGVYAVSLWPAFLVRARSATERVRERWVQLWIVSAGLVLQLVVAGWCLTSGAMNTKRTGLSPLDALHDVSIVHIGHALVGGRPGAHANALGAWGAYAYLIAFLAVAAWLLWDRRSKRVVLDDPRVWAFLAFVLWAGTVSVTAFGSRPVGRYAVAPAFSVAVFVITNVDFAKRRFVSIVFVGLMAVGLARGASRYWSEPRCTRHIAHPWAAEVARWREDGVNRLRVCPGTYRLRMPAPSETWRSPR